MKLKIEKDFTDKYTKKKYKTGSKVEFEDDRANELLSDPRELVTQVAEEPKSKAVKRPVKKSKK